MIPENASPLLSMTAPKNTSALPPGKPPTEAHTALSSGYEGHGPSGSRGTSAPEQWIKMRLAVGEHQPFHANVP